MSGYIQAGYLVTLVALGGYGAALVARERSARRRFTRSDQVKTSESIEPITRGETGDGADQ